MKGNIKIIIFYVVLIGVILVAVATLLGGIQKEDLKYSDIVAMFKSEQVKAFEKAYRIINDKNITLFAANVTGTYSDKHVEGLAPAMEDNRALFYITGMNRVLLLRGMETDFGINPNPKYDEAQDHYSTILTYGNTNSVSIPVTNTDLERTGDRQECL